VTRRPTNSNVITGAGLVCTCAAPYLPTKFAVDYLRAEQKADRTRDARVINTSSSSGLFGNVGQGNYGAAKGGRITIAEGRIDDPSVEQEERWVTGEPAQK